MGPVGLSATLGTVASFPQTFGEYLLLKSLGVGGSGDVVLARSLKAEGEMPRAVIVKRLHRQLAEEEEFVRRFRHEAEIAVSVNSPHVAKVYDAGRVDDTLFIAMEYISGWPLARLVNRLRKQNQQLPVSAALDVARDALRGLSALHNARHHRTGEILGIIHRDVTPRNIMVGEDGVTRLIDLGLGKSTLQDWKTSTGVVMGTPGYMAPEQCVARAVDHRVDLYTLGIVLWECLVGKSYIKHGPVPVMLRAQVAPKPQPPSAFRNDVPQALDAIILRALALKPNDRFGSADEFLHALGEIHPSDDGQTALGTVIGDLLVSELAAQKTEVTRLVAAHHESPKGQPDQEKIVIYAQRASGPSPRLVGDRLPRSPAPRPAPDSRHPSASGPQPTHVTSSPMSPSLGLGLKMSEAVVILALAVLVGIGALWIGFRSGTEVPLGPTVQENTPTVRPTIRPRADARKDLRDVPTEPQRHRPDAPSGRSKELRKTTPPTNGPRNGRKPVRLTPIESPPETSGTPVKAMDGAEGTKQNPAPPALSARQRVDGLIKRAQKLKASLPPGSPKGPHLLRVISQLMMERSSKKIEERTNRILDLEHRLDALASAP